MTETIIGPNQRLDEGDGSSRHVRCQTPDVFGWDKSGQRLAPGDPPAAELAECTCPEFCERDHDNE